MGNKITYKNFDLKECATYVCYYMSLVMRKPAFCICENRDADQLRGNSEADQRLCFRYTDTTIPLYSKSSSHLLWLYSLVCVGPGQKPRKPVFSRQGSNVGLSEKLHLVKGNAMQFKRNIAILIPCGIKNRSDIIWNYPLKIQMVSYGPLDRY